ncbi:MAG TPA: restriction endonuclease subunit S [Desulfotomaculum sp.]|nr:restriction endonuclease subunit S [Desulfotomaculum sp.]
MSRLEELIAELCPDGVEYKTLGEIAVDVYRGSGITRDQVTPIGKPCVRYGEIYTTYGIWFKECVSFTNEATITNKKYFEYGDILFAITGESVEEIAKSCAYIGHEKCLAGGDIVVLKHNQDPRYLSYVLSTTDAQKQKSKGKVKSKVVHSSVPAIGSIRIPLPPLPVQREIVRILDNFAELTAELTTELTARKKQYEYYRNHLLTFSDDVPMVTLGEISIKTYSGGTPLANHAEYYGGDIPWLRTQEVRFVDIFDTEMRITPAALKNSAAKWIPENCVIIAISGATAGRFAINKIPLTTNQHCCCLEINPQKANYRYVFHWVNSQYEKLKALGQGARSDLNSGIIKSYPIPIPSLEEQERIVAILDRFDALCNDLTSGLPAEIEARRKQYEYYRDKLLTFPARPACPSGRRAGGKEATA